MKTAAFLTFTMPSLRYAPVWRVGYVEENFLFRAHEAAPLKESENELFHDSEPALDSAGLQMEKFLSVWVQGKARRKPTMYTNLMCVPPRWISKPAQGFSNRCRAHASDQADVDAGTEGIFARVVVHDLTSSLGRIRRPFSNAFRPRVIGSSRILKTSASGVPRVIQILNVPQGYASDLHSLRPCWANVLSIRRNIYS